MKAIITSLAILFALISTIYSPSNIFGSVSDSGLAAQYTFNGNANDVSGNNNNGTVINTTLTTDRFGNPNHAYLFNGVNSVITIPNSPSISFSNSVGISAWIYLSSIQSSGNRMILGKSNYLTFTNYLMRIKPLGYIQWEYNNYNETTSPLLVNQWYHIYVDAVSPGGTKRVFVNGVQVSVNVISSSGTHNTVSNPLTLGAAGYFGSSYNEFFHGKIDDVRIYDRLLTPTEISDLFNEPNPDPWFRSVTSGNWNSFSTWQMSTNSGSSWIPATITPNNASGPITIQNLHTVSVTVNDSADQVTVNSGGQVVVNSSVTLRIIGVTGTGLRLMSGGIISGSGIIETKGSSLIEIFSSRFDASLRILNDTTRVVSYSFLSSFNGTITIDPMGILNTVYNENAPVYANGVVINNGTISGNGPFIVSGYSFVNNNSVTLSAISFNDTTSISGSGSFNGATVNITNGSFVSIPDNVHFSHIGIFNVRDGGIFNPNSKIFTISAGTLNLINGGIILNSGAIQTQGTLTITISQSNFNAPLNVTSGTTTTISNSISNAYHNGTITIDSGATLNIPYTWPNYTTINGNVINNGTISGNGILYANGFSFANNNSVSINTLNFSDTTSISGAGSFNGTDVKIWNGSIVTLSSDVTFSPTGTFAISGGVLNPNLKTLTLSSGVLFLDNGGVISNSGMIQTQGTPELRVYNSNFNSKLKVRSGITTLRKYPGSFYNGSIIVDSGATMNLLLATASPIIASDSIVNNGTITGSSYYDLSVLGPLFINNGTASAHITFYDTTLLSGIGNFYNSGFTAETKIAYGAKVKLGSNIQFASMVVIDDGGVFDLSIYTLKLSRSGTPLMNNGTLISTNSTIEYNGTTSQGIALTNVNYNNLTINNPYGFSLGDDLSITGRLYLINGDLNLNLKTITLLDTAARLIETPGNTIYGTGSITATRFINQPNSMDIMGMVITSPANFGLTTITRRNVSQNVAPGKPSVKRYFDITPQNNTALNADIVFKYDTSELDTLKESTFGMYRSTDSGTSYSFEGGRVDTLNNLIALNHVQSFSRWTAARFTSVPVSNDSLFLVGNLYAKGMYPIKYGSRDSFTVKIKKAFLPNTIPLRINYIIKNRLTFEIIFDTSFTLPQFNNPDTLILLQIPFIGTPGGYQIFVQSMPEALGIINGFPAKSYSFDVTCDAFNYAEPTDTIRGGQGFSGGIGRMTAAFRNLNTFEIFPINAIDVSFLDTTGVGNAPYRLAVYSDNGSGKPGTALYVSPVLYTPSGISSVETVTHEINPAVNIPASSRFHVGIVQTSNTNIRVAYQDEIPVRDYTFFYSNSDTGNVWFDFASSSKNFRLDISPRSAKNMTLNVLLEGFYNTSINKMIPDTVKLEIRSFNSPYSLIDTSRAVIDSDGNGIFGFTKIVSGLEYFFVVRHRNHIETWSHNAPEVFEDCEKVYDFTNSVTKAFGNNLVLISGKYMIHSGDVNQNGTVDLTDIINVFNDANRFASGYLVTDVTGDDIVDLTDITKVYNNAITFISVIKP